MPSSASQVGQYLCCSRLRKAEAGSRSVRLRSASKCLQLPEDLTFYIFRFLTIAEVASAASSCSSWNQSTIKLWDSSATTSSSSLASFSSSSSYSPSTLKISPRDDLSQPTTPRTDSQPSSFSSTLSSASTSSSLSIPSYSSASNPGSFSSNPGSFSSSTGSFTSLTSATTPNRHSSTGSAPSSLEQRKRHDFHVSVYDAFVQSLNPAIVSIDNINPWLRRVVDSQTEGWKLSLTVELSQSLQTHPRILFNLLLSVFIRSMSPTTFRKFLVMVVEHWHLFESYQHVFKQLDSSWSVGELASFAKALNDRPEDSSNYSSPINILPRLPSTSSTASLKFDWDFFRKTMEWDMDRTIGFSQCYTISVSASVSNAFIQDVSRDMSIDEKCAFLAELTCNWTEEELCSLQLHRWGRETVLTVLKKLTADGHWQPNVILVMAADLLSN